LAESATSQSRFIEARFSNVSELSVRAFGGGFTQLLFLRIEDVSELQWEGIRHRVVELENESLEFYCDEVRVQDSGPPGKVS